MVSKMSFYASYNFLYKINDYIQIKYIGTNQRNNNIPRFFDFKTYNKIFFYKYLLFRVNYILC